MRSLVLAAALALTAAPLSAQTADADSAVRHAVQAFYDAFNSHHFDRAADFTTDDWNHINPYGGRTRGRAAVLAELREVHSTFLRNVSDSVRQMDVRFASPEVAVATVVSQVSAMTTPDGVNHPSERQIRTFVVVRRGSRWLVMQDHNTIVKPLP
ncbi:MAG TPA: SgcJ/EcaC family oxidoreductase [Gemmatimonadales bacterium]|nr:SgcJ/EcaC family oxidoreductase [Gemmatimonadales bacterium]